MNREALLYFLAAFLFLVSALIDYVGDHKLDTGDWLALAASAVFAFIGVRKLRGKAV